MNLRRLVRSSLGWKPLLSHLAVVVVGSAVLAIVAYFHAPRAFATYVMRMHAMLGANQGLADDLQRNFSEAIGEILVVSGGTAAFAALLVSSFVAWRILSPIRSLTATSRRISAGDYRERVQPQWDDELADLARSFNRLAESGEILLSMAPSDPVEPVRQVIDRLDPQFVDKGVSLCRELPTELPPVAADSERLVQVLRNLIGNALQYTHPGGVVTVRLKKLQEAVRYEVHDTGVGLDQGDIVRIFERFYRVEKSRSRRHGGSGIGLTIAAHLVRAHGGPQRFRNTGFKWTSWVRRTLGASCMKNQNCRLRNSRSLSRRPSRRKTLLTVSLPPRE